MNLMDLVNLLLFALALLGLLAVFVLYPLALWLRARQQPVSDAGPTTAGLPTVSLLVVARNAAAIIEAKISNCLALDYPAHLLEIIFYSDGSTDRTEKIIGKYAGPRLRLLSSAGHGGKTQALNEAVAHCAGDILVFSDADALLNREAVTKLTRHFQDPQIGGVCGQRLIAREKVNLRTAQSSYIKFDSLIKLLESRIGSITSNDGKIYAIRRELFQPIAPGATDDLYVCLSIILQGRRFIFEPAAQALIRVPSRSPAHEVSRRRRIVSRSLRGISLSRKLLNPRQYGFYALGLFINKVLRRLLCIFLALLLVSSIYLSLHLTGVRYLLAAQLLFYGLALSHSRLAPIKTLGKIAGRAFYFCLGAWGSLLGVVDFVRGRFIEKWEPVKTDG